MKYEQPNVALLGSAASMVQQGELSKVFQIVPDRLGIQTYSDNPGYQADE